MAHRTRDLRSTLRTFAGGARGRADSPPSTPSWLRENLEHSLPFVLAGGLCLGVGFWIDATTVPAPGHPSLWLLLVAVGAVVVGGGVALTFVSEEPDGPAAPSDERFVLVDRAEWERLRSPVTTEAVEASSVPPSDYLEDVPASEPSPSEPPPWDETEPERTAPVPPWAPSNTPPAASGPASFPSGPGLSRKEPDTPPRPASLTSPSLDALGQGPVVTHPGPVSSPQPPSAPPRPSAAASPSPPPGPEARSGLTPQEPAPGRRLNPSVPGPPPSPLEAQFEELVSELNAVAGPAEVPVPPAPHRSTLTSTIARSQNRCISCAGPLEEGSGSICVSCETPLCQSCQDASMRKRGVALCTECARVFDHPDVWLTRQPEG
jgi:hypothetical protein